MVITKRTKLSLCELLGKIGRAELEILLEKNDVYIESCNLKDIRDSLFDADDGTVGKLINEIIGKRGYLSKSKITASYVFNELWADFAKCLMLDGYKIEQSNVVRIEPLIESSEPIEDDLTKELQKTSLPSSDKIISLIKNSAEEFKKPIPDYYNGCLTSTRVALETLVKEIAVQKNFVLENDDKKVWGNSLRHLKEKEFITENEEKAIASFYTFISKGAHRPLGFTDEEFVRFGINLAISACYFLVKILNGDEGS